jgi:predicted amidophosphoribosyltransferase
MRLFKFKICPVCDHIIRRFRRKCPNCGTKFRDFPVDCNDYKEGIVVSDEEGRFL